MNLVRLIGDRHLFELLRGSLVALVFKFSGIFLQFLFLGAIASMYGTRGTGIFQTLWTILMISAVLAKFGFDTSIVRYIAAFYRQKNFSFIKRVYKIGVKWIVIFGIMTTAILALLSEQVSVVFFESEANSELILYIALMIIPLALIHYNAESIKALKNVTGFSILQNGTIYVFTLLFVGILYLSHSYNINNIIYSLGFAIIAIVLLSYFMLQWNFRKKIARSDLSKTKFSLTNSTLLKTSFPMLLSSSLFLVMSWTDILMLSYYMPEEHVGVYTVAMKIAGLTGIVLVAVNSIAMPKFAEINERNDKALFRNFIKQSTLLIFLTSLPILLIIFIIPGGLLEIFGGEFGEGKYALLILGCGQFFSAISGSTLNILNMTGKEKTGRNILFISAFINIVMNYFLIPLYGIEGAAIATASTTVLWNVLAVVYIYRQFGFLTYPINVKIRR